MTERLKPGITRQLGTSALRTSAVWQGCMQLAQGGLAGRVYTNLGQQEATDIVRSAVDSGITCLDTAEMYRHADHRLATALAEIGVDEDALTIATKWNPYGHFARSMTRRLLPALRARNQRILHQIHHPVGSPSTMEAQLRQLVRMREKDVIDGAGVSNFSARRIRKAHRILTRYGLPLATAQVRGSLLRRTIDTNGVWDTCQELKVSPVFYFPLESGLLTGMFHDIPGHRSSVSLSRKLAGITRANVERVEPLVKRLAAIGERYHRRPAQVALNCLLAEYPTAVVVVGASTPWQAVDNAAATNFQLTADERGELVEVAAHCVGQNKPRRRPRSTPSTATG